MPHRLITGAITTLIAPAQFGAKNSHMVSTRLTLDQLQRVARAADVAGIPIGQWARAQLTKLTAPSDGDFKAQLKLIALDLGLDGDSDPEVVLEAVQKLVDELTTQQGPSASGDPLAQVPDVAPAKLSASDNATAARIKDPAKRAKFIELRQKFTAKPTPVIQAKPRAKT